ncbi:tyrosine-type recombinase/integrase [Pseudorhodoplanes sp.]|uniref:tyrosine-type recombinase/integrase n=1 Tax=Pseudorhodoplanes sp. TaxID=1934341 RepID=UPI003D14EF6B
MAKRRKRRKTGRGQDALSLTLDRIERMKTQAEATGKTVRTRDGKSPGLYLEVRSETNAFWTLRYARAGKERWMGLGALSAFGLEDARERARLARQALSDGLDPMAEKQKAKAEALKAAGKAKTFKEASETFFKESSPNWKNAKHVQQYTSTMTDYVFPKIGAMLADDITKHDVLAVLKQPLDHKNGEMLWNALPETARRIRSRIERVFNYAKAHGWRSADNPAAWKGNLEPLFAGATIKRKKGNFAALEYDDLPAFVADLAKRDGTAARALEFLILTAARTAEVIGATWNEIDLDKALWVIPGSRMKMGEDHRVPLSKNALGILRSLPKERGNPHVFIGPSGGRGLSNAAMSALLDRMAGTTFPQASSITVHGFRSCFRDWAAERTNYPREVCERALAHKVVNKVEAAYQRSDLLEKRRPMMEAWATFAYSPPPKANNVTPLRSA